MKKILISIFIIGSWAVAHAQQPTLITLDKILDEIDKNFPSIIRYQSNIEMIQARAEGAKAWMPPTLSSGLMRFPYKDFSMLKEEDPMNEAGISIAIEQMIPNSSKLNAKKTYLNSLAETEKSKREWTKNELRREAKILYYNRYTTQKKQAVLKESRDLLNLLLSTAEAKFSNNQSQLQTIYKAKARLAEINNMSLMLDGIIAESNIGLNTLMVQRVDTAFKIDTLIVPNNYAATTIDTANVSTRSDIAAMTNSIASMKLQQRAMKIGVRPDFGVRAEHMQMLGMPNQWSLMGMITIPIVPWASKMYSSETKAMGFEIEAMEKEKETMTLMAQRMRSEKLIMLGYENAQYQNFMNSLIPAYEDNLQANLLAYRQNTGDFFVLLDAWEMLLMKELEAYDKLFNILKLEADYEYENEIK